MNGKSRTGSMKRKLAAAGLVLSIAVTAGNVFGGQKKGANVIVTLKGYREASGELIAVPFNTADAPARPAAPAAPDRIYEELAALTPARKHYQQYYQTREANENLWHPPQGVHAFMRAYYHVKSADWTANQPHPLQARTASEWAKMPRSYIMDLNKGMAEQVAAEMPSAAAIAANKWLPDSELRVYAEEFGRTGYQGGLNGYRVGAEPAEPAAQIFAGRTVDVPATFMGGKSDWGVYQNPGAIERLEKNVCTNYRGTHLVQGAGHWVQQEQPAEFARLADRAALTLKDLFFVTPILMGTTMFVQQKMTPAAGADPVQQRMMLMMPVIFTVMFLNLPSGLVLYWFVNNLLGIGQQWLVNRHVARAEAAAAQQA